jgi:hypothetical protein
MKTIKHITAKASPYNTRAECYDELMKIIREQSMGTVH